MNITLQIKKENLKQKLGLKDGKDGKNYVLTEADRQAIANSIDVPIVEKTVVEQPIVKEVAVGDNPLQIVEKLQSIEDESEKLSIEAIKDLRKELDRIERKIGARPLLGGGFNVGALNFHVVDDETPSGTIDGVNTIFNTNNIPSPSSSLKVYLNGQRMRITEDYTVSGTTITFINAPLTNSILLCDYRV